MMTTLNAPQGQARRHAASRGATRRRRHPRGVAMLLVMIALVLTVTLGLSFLAAQSTTTGIARNATGQTQARAIAESALDMSLAHIRTTSNWRALHPSGVWLSNQSYGGGTFTLWGVDADGNLGGDPTNPVTMTATGYYNNASHTVSAVVSPTVVNGPNLLVYGQAASVLPQSRYWTGSSWWPPQSAQSIGSAPVWVVTRYAPTRNETAAALQNSANTLTLELCTGAAWTSPTTLAASIPASTTRAFDMAYEQVSGRLMIVYRSGSDSKVHYRTWDGTTLSADAALTMPTAGNPAWLRLLPQPGSNQMVLLSLDTAKVVCAAVWNSSSWGNTVTLEASGSSASAECMSGAWLNGTAVTAWGVSGLGTFRYRTWNGAAWSGTSAGPALTKEPQWLRLASSSANTKALAATLDSANAVKVLTWDGATWGSPLTIETAAPGYASRSFDIGFEYGTGDGLVVWAHSGSTNCYYRTFTGGAWSAQATGPALANTPALIQLTSGTGNGQVIVAALEQTSGALDAVLWDGTAFDVPVALGAGATGSTVTEAFMVATSGTLPPSPTSFGNRVVYGSTQNWVGNTQIATQVTLAQAGTLQSITAYTGGSVSKKVRYALYSDLAGEPKTLLAQTASVAAGSVSNRWLTISAPAVALSPGTYWLALAFNNRNLDYVYTSAGKTRYYNRNAVGSGFIGTWGSSSNSLTRQISIYATIVPSGGGSAGQPIYLYATDWQE